jgi:ABC-2 type transport system ATP-binding protein
VGLSIKDAREFFRKLKLSAKDREIAKVVLTEIEARLDFMINVGIEYLTLDRRAHTLSGGEAQRIRLASQLGSGLVGALYVLDEPTIGLDPTQIRETRNLIKELGERHTVLLSSHILSEVEQTCDRTIIIAAGRIVASGSPQDLRNRFSAQARVVAEVRGPQQEVESGARGLPGVQKVEASSNNGWVRVAVDAKPDHDVREDLYRLTTAKGWTLRELRREGATLEDFFVQVTAEQQSQRTK